MDHSGFFAARKALSSITATLDRSAPPPVDSQRSGIIVSADAAGGGHGNAGIVLAGGAPLVGGASCRLQDDNKMNIVKASTENHAARLTLYTNRRRGLLSDLHRFHAHRKIQADRSGSAISRARARLT